MDRPLNRIQSTAGAIPVRNEKGEFRMEKVKVTRYMPGRRPDYARDSSSSSSSSEDEDEGEEEEGKVREEEQVEENRREYGDEEVARDRRLARLRERTTHVERQHRHVEDPQVIYDGNEEEDEEREGEVWGERRHLPMDSTDESDSGGEEQDEEVIDRRRQLMKERAQQRREEELMDVLEEEEEEERKRMDSDDSSDYDEYTDSEDELGPRLKPVFVRKADRVTLKNREDEEEEEKQKEKERKIATEKRKNYSTKMVAEAINQELQKEQGATTVEDVVNTDDENEEEEYEAWKVRELQRIKRDREEIETLQREKEELENIHNMTEEERRSWLRLNPRHVTNQKIKGKYRFLQKYYHRGVFYIDEEDETMKRNFAEPTLEDHFDKTVLPKVMQVKDFGRAGRTKYTHLVDQDTTVFDNAWSQATPVNIKYQYKGGGFKDQFEKPSRKKQKTS